MTDEANTFGGGQFGGQFSSGLSTSASQLITDALRATNVVTTDSTYRARALSFANYIYLHLLQSKRWRFSVKEYGFDLFGPYSTGVVDYTQGSDIITEHTDTDAGILPTLQFNSNMVGQLFVADQSSDTAYRVHELDGSKSLRIRPAYAEDSGTNQAYAIYTDRYTLDVKVQEIRALSVGGVGKIKPTNLERFRTIKMRDPSREGLPEMYTVVNTEEDSGQLTVEVYPSPDKRYAVTLEYLARPTRLEDSATCFPLIPPEHMNAMYYALVAEIYVFQNNDAMARSVGRKAAEAFAKMAADYAMVDPVPRIQHNRNYFNRRHRDSVYYGLKYFGKVED